MAIFANFANFANFGAFYVRMSVVMGVYNSIFLLYGQNTLNVRAGVVLGCEMAWCRYSKRGFGG